MYSGFISHITTTHHFHTQNTKHNVHIYMHMDSPNDLYECGTTPTHRFARVMLLDFSRHNLPEVCYWTSSSVMHSISLRLYMNA